MTFSDGKRYVVVGAHHDPAHWRHRAEGRRIPVVEVKYPANPGFVEEDEESHDFALLVLQFPVQWSDNGETRDSPHCLMLNVPVPSEKYLFTEAERGFLQQEGGGHRESHTFTINDNSFL